MVYPMKKCSRSKWLSIFFVCLLGGISLWNLMTPDREFSESENRYLKTFPKVTVKALFSGNFLENFDTYTTDQFPMRDSWVTVKTLSQLALLKQDNGRVYFGSDNRLYGVPDPANPLQEEENCRAVASFLSAIRKECPVAGLSVMLVPTASTILPDGLPAFAPVADEAALLERMNAALQDTDDIRFVDPTAALLAAKDAHNLYYRTDHHWTIWGAYAAYQEWATQMGITPQPVEAYQVKTVADDFAGTLFSKAGLSWYPKDIMEAFLPTGEDACTISTDGGKTWKAGLYNEDALSTRDKYTYFLYGNYPVTEIRTQADGGKTLLVVKDSYAHSFVPFLTGHYERILMVDPRYFKEDLRQWTLQQHVDDVLVLYNAATFAADTQLSAVL